MLSSKEGDKDASRKVKFQKRPELNNGGSLEDCISNVYSLLELSGIKWKCYRTKSNAPRGVPLTMDAVLKSYSKCILDGILCTWRRKQLTATGNNELLPLPHFSNDTPKELWVFWYDEEPAALQQHCEGLECDEELSSANQMNIVSYEVRTILFKALHVVLERDLTKDGFVRFGRWFTVPLETRAHYLHYMYPTYSPAIRLNFFVHGANTVCAAVQAQRQPTLLTLAKRHLDYKSIKRFAVIVGPWSMRGILVQDQMQLLADPKMQETAEKEWNHWKEYLQMEEKEPEKVPESERKSSPEPEVPQATPHRSLLTDSSDEELAQNTESVAEPVNEEIPQRLRWMYEPECRTEKAKEETQEEKEKREQEREVRRKRRKDREDRRKEIERQRAEGTNPEDYDSEVLTEAEEEPQEDCVNNDVPKMVLLEIDGVRMLYPSKFVCVTLEDDRQVLETMGFKTNTVPEELQVQGRRPRNKFVVNVSNPILSAQAVYQYCVNDRTYKYDQSVVDPSPRGYEQSMAIAKAKFARWKFSERQTRCQFFYYGCKCCRLHWRKGIKTGQYNLSCNDSKELYRDVVNRVRRKQDYDAYHKRRRVRVKPMSEKKRKRVKRKKRKMRRMRIMALKGIVKKQKFIMSKKRQRLMAQKEEAKLQKLEEQDQKERDEQFIKDELRPSSVIRADSEDESYQMEKLSQQDWANFEDEESPPAEDLEIEKEPDIFNTIKISKPAHDENFSPDPFLPLSFVSRKTNSSDFEYKVGDDDMSEERFNEVYRDKSNKWRPGMSRSEKIECGDYQVDPSNQQKGSPRPYHVKELPKKIKWEAKLPMPRNNKYFKGAVCKKGLRGSEEMWIQRDKKIEQRKADFLSRYRKSMNKHQLKVAKWCAKKVERESERRSLETAIKSLKKIAKDDSRSEGTKQYKMSMVAFQKKYEEKKKEEASKNTPQVEDALQNLDVNSFCIQYEKTGPQGQGMSAGYISPAYATSPISHVEEESESDTDEQRNGLGEGTSMQYQDGDAVDVDVKIQHVDNAMIEVTETIGHARSAGEHVGPEGLLSPPASNEMPKGGPLSVGPPSIESQGLNQIYPTPPSVQMLQADAAQAHSPLLHGRSRCMNNLEDDIERITVSGGGGFIVEIDADDAETENMKKWNHTSAQSKMSKFLASSCENPILIAKKRKFVTPVTEKFKIEEKTKKSSAGLAYKNMVTRKFECPPPHAFAEIVRSKIHEKRIAALSASSAATIPASIHQSSPMIPMFQSPSMPPHIPSPSVGSMGQMTGHGYPGTPGPFPPTTPTYPGMMSRPGANFGPGPAFPHQMVGPGFNGPMGQIGSQRPPFMNPQNMMPTHQQMQMMRMQQQMMQNRPIGGQGVPPGYGPGMAHYSPGPSTPGPNGYGMQHQGASSVQQLNMFVNQTRFGANAPPHPGHPPPYGNMQPMIPQSPNYNQPFGGMNNPMMSPMQQHQFHQQQIHQQMQMQQHQQQMQRSQMQQQLSQPQQPQQQQIMPPAAQQLQMQQQQQLHAALVHLTPRQKKKFAVRQRQLIRGIRPTSLQPLVLRKMQNPPDANIPINKQLAAPYRPQESNVPEGDSLTIAIILSDTILDLHFDSVFDSCPICACSVSIRSRDLGMYITPHEVLRSANPGHCNMREHTVGTWSGFHVNSATNCTCGFSAIRHRYLSCCSGLFAEDANEATTLDNAVAPVVPPMEFPKKNTARNMSWFDSRSVHDMALLDQIRQMSFSNSLGKAISQMATVKEHRRDMGKAMEIDMDITVPSEYVISHVDSMELLMLGNSAIDMSMKMSSIRNQTVSAQKFLTYFHPWGLQTANEISELEANEWVDLLGTVTLTLEGAVKQVKHIPVDTTFTIEGPMTWKQFVSKSIRGRLNAEEEDDFSLAEPIPAVMRATTKEAIRVAPHIDQYYEQAGLAPVDQPKDVMYITIIPDDDETYEKTVKFMETVTMTYEKMHLGRHVPFPVSTRTATRFREVYKSCQNNYTLPEQHQQLVSFVNQSLMRVPQKLAEEPKPLDPTAEKWADDAARKMAVHEAFKKGPSEDFLPVYKGTHEEFCEPAKTYNKLCSIGPEEEYSASFLEREGILRVGTPCEPIRTPLNQTVTSTAEFNNMTKHLKDNKGFVTRLKLYLQQMEDLVTNTLVENAEAFERRGYRYQLAVEARLKQKDDERKKAEEKLRYDAAKVEDDRRAATGKKPEEVDIVPGTELGNDQTEAYVDDDEEEFWLKKQIEDEQYPPEGEQAPSPIPAGMIHIPETLSEQERLGQPSLTDLFHDATSVMPHNASSISWKQRDTSVPNPFPSSNQPPVAFESVGSSETDDYATLPHVIVIYMVNPFTYGPEGHSALHMRIAVLSFIRVFNAIMGRLPYNKRPQLQLEIIGMESMDEASKPIPDYFNDPRIPFDILHGRPNRLDKPGEATDLSVARSLSIAVYTHPRVFFPDVYKSSSSARCMTAFGPGSQLINTIIDIDRLNADAFQCMSQRSKTALHALESGGFRHPGALPHQHIDKKNYIAYRVPSTIVCLAPPPMVCQMEENGKPVMNPVDEQTLFVAYCLVGTDFLVATATDAQGKLIDNCIANIKPRRQNNELYRYKNKTQILDGMGKLWSFILGIMSSEIKNWRLVVGRLGRIGHGEFRAWTHLLNKTSLLRYSGILKDICGACRSMPTIVGTPAILSACLISLEPEPSIRVIPEFYDHDASTKKNSIFQTPGDLSSTHILTFPVGAEINLEVQDQTVDAKAEENWEFGDLDIMEGLDDGDTEIMKDLGLETPSSAAIRQPGVSSMFFSEDSSTIEIQNQPLASGYYISTSPAPELPTWFWATCPSAKRHCPVHLKSSLHINISEVKNDDIAMESTKEKDKEKDKEEKDMHPLESRQTEEVLRHVLESYNALSWLNINRQNGERYSCLPIHIQHLLRLYHSVARLLA